MAVFKRQTIQHVEAAQKPQLAPLSGLKLAKRSRVVPVMRAQDKVGALSRRIVAAQSLAAESAFLVPDVNPSSGTTTHPTATQVRVVHRTRIDITPGCFLKLAVLYMPCGQTQGTVLSGGSYPVLGASASVRVTVTWTDQASNQETTSADVDLLPSPLQYAALPTDTWASFKIGETTIYPATDLEEDADLATWTRHVSAEITISQIGGARVVDAVVYEVPRSIAREVDDAANLWTSHLYADEEPDGNAPPLTHPFQRFDETTPDGDPRGVGWHLSSVANAQRSRLGPALFSWTAWNEGAADVSTATIPQVTTASTSFVRLWDQVATSYSADEPGWSITNDARSYGQSHPFWSTVNGSIPVLVAVYAATSLGSESGTVRIQASDYSWIDVTVNSNTYGWSFAYGHLRCGVGVGDQSVVQAFFRIDTGTGLNVRALSCWAWPDPLLTPASSS